MLKDASEGELKEVADIKPFHAKKIYKNVQELSSQPQPIPVQS
jgi:hypothetical protein